MSRWFLPALLVSAAAFAQAPAVKDATVKADGVPAKSAFDKAQMEAYMRHQFLITSQFDVQVQDPKPSQVQGFMDLRVIVTDGKNPQEVTFLVTRDGRHIFQGKVFDIADNPFRSELNALTTENQPAIGTAGAPVAIVLFSDLQCSYCREQSRMLRKLLLQNYPTKVRLYFKDLPIEQIHAWARPAAILGRCVFRQSPDAFWNYHDWVFDKQGEITDPVALKTKALEWAAAQKLEAPRLAQCFDRRETEAEVDRSLAEARALQVASTPTMFVNGRRLVGQLQWEQLRNVIDAEIEYQKTAKNAGDRCCESRPSLPGIAK